MEADRRHLRARDADRVEAMRWIDVAHVDGQLTIPEHKERLAAALSAKTVGELDALVADLQPAPPSRDAATEPSGRSQPGGRLRGLGPGRLAAVLSVLALVAAVVATVAVLVDSRDLGETSTDAGLPSRGLLSETGLRDVIDAAEKKFGTTVVAGVHVYPTEAEVVVRNPSVSSGSTRWQFRSGGELHSPENYGGLAVNSGPEAPDVDLADLDVARVAELIASAPRKLDLGLSLADVPDYFRVTIGGDDGGEIWIGVNGIGSDSHLVARLDGTIKAIAN
ncbi:DUF1707 domain-containing protein [Gordonia sinesedis]